MTEQPGVTTPVTDRPLTAEDVALLREGDLLVHNGDDELMTFVRVLSEGERLAGQLSVTFPDGSGGINHPHVFTFVSRPPSVSADPVGGVTSDAGPAAEFWANVETGASEGGVTSGAGEVAPFAKGGVGHAMQERGYAYLKEYILSTDGADYEPNDFERSMLEDFMNGLLGDEAMFGPVRELLAAKSALTPSPPVQLSEREREAVDDVKGRIATWDGHDAGSVQVGVSVDTLRTILAALTRTTGEGS